MAFGDTGVLDAFGRTENPLSDGGKWSSPIWSGDSPCQANGSACVRTANFSESYRSDQTYGADCEAFFTVTTIGDTTPYCYVFARLKDEDSGFDGYHIAFKASDADEVKLFRDDNESGTQLGAAITQTHANGDKIGIECIGSTIKAFFDDGGAGWGEIGSRTDSTYGAAGHVGVAFGRDNWVIDDFGGGTVVPADITVTPGVATLTITAFAPTVGVTDLITVAPGVATLTVTTFAPTIQVTDLITVAPGLATLSLTAFAPTIGVTEHIAVAPGVSTLTITAFAPTVQVTGDVTVSPGVASLTLTAYAPTAQATDHKTVSPGVATLTITAFAPTIAVSDHQTVAPGVAALSLTAYAPTVALTDHITITPGAAALILSAFAPTVQLTGHILVSPGVAALTMTAYAPTIVVGALLVAVPEFTIELDRVWSIDVDRVWSITLPERDNTIVVDP